MTGAVSAPGHAVFAYYAEEFSAVKRGRIGVTN